GSAGLPLLKVQVCGPVTLGASVELPNLHKVLTDPGAFRDLTASLAEGVKLHLLDLANRLPGTRLVLQVDEPSLPAALAGRIPTPSGYGTVRSLDLGRAETALGSVLAAAGEGSSVVHCCAPDVPFELIRRAGARGIAVDYDLLGKPQLDAIGELVDGGVSVWLGIAPALDAAISLDLLRGKVTSLWQRLGFAPEEMADALVVTPACGLAGASPGYARRVMSLLRDVAESLRDT
ncbi:MAG: Methionine synthase vitamin-B12 independent, partial [Frankiales bacterium]|nr:Methionine synthase vitamin-B12 independent [Frankiales bacterium]